MDELLHDLAAAQAKLRDLDKRRADQLAYRDSLIVRSLAAGATWATVQRVAGLTPRSVALSVKRSQSQ